MKCQRCEKPATFHITELTGDTPQELHLCADHAQAYLAPAAAEEPPESFLGALAQQFKVGQTAAQLARLDQKACPYCGITFYEFRHAGRLGCPHDYVCFAEDLEPLILNIHGATEHAGKRPKRHAQSLNQQTELIRLRREMKEAVDREDYERASQLRDEIRGIEQGSETDSPPPEPA
ncbi:UvrB/UvrC motif-containing protein [Lignipirellula cremea]|uniref:UvrB/uvrC motif protein n=1 Tax=Lignipirellula cremea TaxID=2528010 RepID=A0A518DMY3_9BACT|nr:UvrB/UvrC motif-containing protein [Lignipirellula cremea]QDU93182.1 UvrB/uvrC motif protein [Lignipirellula cremea]